MAAKQLAAEDIITGTGIHTEMATAAAAVTNKSKGDCD